MNYSISRQIATTFLLATGLLSAAHADSGGANHRQLLRRMLANGLIYRRAVNHYAQRRDDSYRRYGA